MSMESVLGGVTDRLVYGDYMVPGADPKAYEQVKDTASLIPTVSEYLLDYNAESKTPMGLVMFLDAVEHVSRISRILRQVFPHTQLHALAGMLMCALPARPRLWTAERSAFH